MVCRKLIKWTVIPVLGVAGAGYLLFGKGLCSYASTAYSDVKKAVQGGVPVDFELRRARNLIQKIDPEIQEARRDVARAEVELDGLNRQIDDLKGALAKAETKMRRHKSYLSDEGETVTVFEQSRDYGVASVKTELCRTFDMYRNQAELLKSKEALRQRQSQVLEAARSKLVSVRSERDKLIDLVATLEAKKRQLDAMAASSQKYDLDTSSLAEAKALLADIQKRLDISQKIIQEELFLATGSVAPQDEVHRDIVKEIDSYFGAATNGAPAKLAPVKGTH